MKRAYLLLMAVALLQGCMTLNKGTMKKTVLIDPGMGKSEVLDILGPPGDRQFNGSDEAWQYCQTSIGGNTDKFAVIWFRGGMVSGMTSYTGSALGMCSSHFRSINWEQAPDTTIEIRRR